MVKLLMKSFLLDVHVFIVASPVEETLVLHNNVNSIGFCICIFFTKGKSPIYGQLLSINSIARICHFIVCGHIL